MDSETYGMPHPKARVWDFGNVDHCSSFSVRFCSGDLEAAADTDCDRRNRSDCHDGDDSQTVIQEVDDERIPLTAAYIGCVFIVMCIVIIIVITLVAMRL